MCPQPQIVPLTAPKRQRWEVIISLKVGREWKTLQCIVRGGGQFCNGDQRYSHAGWVAGVSSLCLGHGRGHLLPWLLASSHVRTLDRSHGSSESRRPGPRLPTGPLDPGLCGMGPWALGCVWDRGMGDPGSCHWLIGIYPDLESEHSGSSAWEDSGQNPGVKGLGSSAGRVCGGGLPPMGEVSASSACGEGVWGSNSRSHQDPLAQPLGSHCGFRSQDPAGQGLGIRDPVVGG